MSKYMQIMSENPYYFEIVDRVRLIILDTGL